MKVQIHRKVYKGWDGFCTRGSGVVPIGAEEVSSLYHLIVDSLLVL